MTGPVLLFERNDAIRESLADWLAVVLPQQELVQARDRTEAVGLARDRQPGVILLDIDPLGVAGIDAIHHLRDAAPSAAVVVLAIDDYQVLHQAAITAGADAYVRTWQVDEELLPVLEELLEPGRDGVGTKTVLCIEDELEMVKLIQLTLERGPFRVVGALSGQEGLDLARRVRPDVVLLDLMMPDMEGSEVYRRLKADDELKDVPIIVVSVMHPSSAEARGVEAEDYVTKPFELEAFRRKVMRVVNGSGAEEERR